MIVGRGSFDVTLTPETPEQQEGHVAMMKIEKRFSGDLEAASVGRMLAVQTPIEGSAGYVAIEYVTGQLAGRSGSFALQHLGVMDRGDGELRVTVVPDSGTDDLTGISGEMAIDIVDGSHLYVFEYSLPVPTQD